MSDTETFRIIVIKEEDGMFAAQCLEYDICTQAETIEQLTERLLCQIEVERALSREKTGEDFGGIPAAPEKFHEMWDCGVELGSENSMNLRMAA